MHRLVQRLARSPGLQLALGGLVVALVFPATGAGTLGLLAAIGGLGVAAALAWPHAPAWLRRPPEEVAAASVLVLVAAAGVTTFWEALTVAPDWPMGDWGPQHAVLARIMPYLPGLDVPVWNHVVSTGDAPLELYPALTYLVTGHLAKLLGLDGDLAHALMIVAVLVHVTLALATAAIAMRVGPKPLALGVGLVMLVDTGAIAHGGTVGLFRWALLHSAMAIAFSTVAALGVLAALRRPRLGASLTIWIFTALATATHPAGLLATAASIVALAVVALLAGDVPPRRALVALGHVALGAALGAAAWIPLAERIFLYGQHYPNALRSPVQLVEDLLAAPTPVTAYALFVYAGYLGIVVGVLSRRAAVVFVASSALVLLVGLCDAPYLALDLAPGPTVARLGAERLAQLARPFVAVAGAYAIAVLLAAVRRAWASAGSRQRLVGAAVLAISCASLLRVAPRLWANASTRAANEARVFAPDPEGRELLTAWARAQAQELGPERWARAVFEQDTHEQMHLTATTGLPVFHMLWIPDLLLRERIEDLSEASLRRFNVRWAIGVGRSPSIGDASTEIVLGSYHVREIPSWDGQFARIERGEGQIRVLRLDDRAVEIEVTGTTAPVLVALGTGFYPRWRARHASGAAQPVYALPTIPDGRLRVVSAWVAPGRTTFTVDGPLPSDGKGRALSLLAGLVALAGVVAWSIRRVRLRILRQLARWRARLPRVGHVVARIGVPVLLLVLLLRGCREDGGSAPSLELGAGLRATAKVDARVGGGRWQRCAYSALEGAHLCPGVAVVSDGMVQQLNDTWPSWDLNTPAIVATSLASDVELRIRLSARLAGTYWARVSDGAATLAVEGEPARELSRDVLTYVDRGERSIVLRARPSSARWSFTFVREDTLLPPRAYLVPPPDAPPPAVRAIR